MLELTEDSQKVIDKLVFCSDHADEILKLYCNDCEDVICMMCQVVKHKSHETVTVQEALDKLLPEVDKDLGVLGLKLEDITKAIAKTEEEKAKADKAYEECEKIFDKKIEERIKQLCTAQTQVKGKMRKEREQQVIY